MIAVVRPIAVIAWAAWALLACEADLAAPRVDTTPLAVGETRRVELGSTRLDVRSFKRRIPLDDLRTKLAPQRRRRFWLLDLDLTGGRETPRFMDEAVARLQTINPDDPGLSPAARNLVRLVQMTPNGADLSGTALEGLLNLAPKVGVPPGRVLAEVLGADPDRPILPPEALRDAMLDGLIRSHPRARSRPAPPGSSAGAVDVPPGRLPVTLAEALSDMASLSETYGEVTENGVFHPGFIFGDVRADLTTESFAIVVTVNANALPYKGLDATNAGVGSVNAISRAGAGLIDFGDPDWLSIEGLVQTTPVIERIRFRIFEAPRFVPGGRTPDPAPLGASEVWTLAPYYMESLVARAAAATLGPRFRDRSVTLAYPDTGRAVFRVEIADGFARMIVGGNLGDPPPPAYLWDVLLEAAQVKLHEGAGGVPIPEGEAVSEIELTDVPVGLSINEITANIRAGVRADPGLLVDLAATLFDNAAGAPDVYYLRAGDDDAPAVRGDWLVFIAPEDIPPGPDGRPARPWRYTRPGFFSDPALTRPLGDTTEVGGDRVRTKVRVRPGDVLYIQDDDGVVFRLVAAPKPAPDRLALDVTRSAP